MGTFLENKVPILNDKNWSPKIGKIRSIFDTDNDFEPVFMSNLIKKSWKDLNLYYTASRQFWKPILIKLLNVNRSIIWKNEIDIKTGSFWNSSNMPSHYSDKPNFPPILAWKCIKLNLLLFKEKKLCEGQKKIFCW